MGDREKDWRSTGPPKRPDEVWKEIRRNGFTLKSDNKGLHTSESAAGHSAWYAYNITDHTGRWRGEFHVHIAGNSFAAGNLHIETGAQQPGRPNPASQNQWLADRLILHGLQGNDLAGELTVEAEKKP
jgi:hypothetical protein